MWFGSLPLLRRDDFMRERGLTVGDDPIKYKAAREKTSGLVDLGLINENHRLTSVGRRILEISQSEDYSSDNPLLIPKKRAAATTWSCEVPS